MDLIAKWVEKSFHPWYKNNVAQYIADLLEPNINILDFGCFDGQLSQRIMELRPDVQITGIDIDVSVISVIKRVIYNGEHLPFKDNSFHTVIAVDCLHHTTCVPGILRELKRVTQNSIIIKDHMANNLLEKHIVSFADWSTNYMYGIKCYYNFQSRQEWFDLFKKFKLTVVSNPPGNQYGFGLNQRFNPVFKLLK
jgi:ubiquinone/menaquinone biosynthesis C-methylase UbiE